MLGKHRSRQTTRLRWKNDEVPKVFLSKEILPLALNIHFALIERVASPRWTLARFLRRHCRSPQYLCALALEGSSRHDVDGRPVGPVSELNPQTENPRRLGAGWGL